MLKVKPIYRKIDLAFVADGSVEGEIFVLLNPPRRVMEDIAETGMKISAWSSAGGKNKKVGEALEQKSFELWAEILSLDGQTKMTPDEVKELRASVPRYLWLTLTDEAVQNIIRYEKEIAKKVMLRARRSGKDAPEDRRKS